MHPMLNYKNWSSLLMVHQRLIFKLRLSIQASIEYSIYVSHLVRKSVRKISVDHFLLYSGNYHISLTYDGEHIDGSPYHLRLRSQPSQEQVVPPALPPPINPPPRATIEPIEFHVC